jgi:N-acetylneuraminic acid mutarotase
MRPSGMSRSPAMQRIYLRRRIVAGVLALGIPILIIVLLTRGGKGGGSKVGTGSTTTTASKSTTTVAPTLVVAASSWHLPVPLARLVVLPANTNLAVFGGITTSATSKTIYQIDPVTGIATNIGTMPAAVHDAAGAVIGSNFYVFGGGGATEVASVQQFGFSNSDHMTGSVIGNLPAKRADSAAVTVNGQVYLVGGFDGKQWLPAVISTNDGKTFATQAQLNPAVRYPAVAVVNGKLYVIGGELSPNQADATTIQQIDLQSFAVANLSPLPVGLSHASAATLNDTIYVFGGRSGGHAIDTISVLNPTTGQLQVVGHLPTPRSDMGVAVVGQTAYLLGGEGDTAKPVNTVFTVRLGTP